MSLLERIDGDIKNAMKNKLADRLSVLRMLKAGVLNAAIAKKKDALDDSEIQDVIQKQAKQRKESVESFTQAGRKELADKEKNELAILAEYLPKQLSEGEIKKLAHDAIRKSGASTKAQAGLVMKELMPQVKGKADGKLVNQIVLRELK